MNAAEFHKHALIPKFRPPGFGLSALAASQRMRMGTISYRLFVSLAATILTMIATVAMPSASTGQANQAASRTIPASVEAQLDAHIKRYIDWYEAANCEQEPGNTCRGIEYRKARRFCFGDINGDGKEDIAVLYTLEELLLRKQLPVLPCRLSEQWFRLRACCIEGSGRQRRKERLNSTGSKMERYCLIPTSICTVIPCAAPAARVPPRIV